MKSGFFHCLIRLTGSFDPMFAQGFKTEALRQDFHHGVLHNKKFAVNDSKVAPSAPSMSSFFQTDNFSGSMNKPKPAMGVPSSTTIKYGTAKGILDQSSRVAGSKEVNDSTGSLPARRPIFHASGLGAWYSVITYDACVRLCLHSWATGCVEEAPQFLNNECALLRNAFGLQKVLLQPEEDLLTKQSPELVSEKAGPKIKTAGKMKVQVRKVQVGLVSVPGCNFTSLTLQPSMIKLELLRQRFSTLNSKLCSGLEALRKVHVTTHIPANGSFSRKSVAYMQASTQYVKQVSKLLKNRVTASRSSSSSCEVVSETYSCSLKLKSSSEGDAVRTQPGTGETYFFMPDSFSDDLVIEVHDSQGLYCGQVVVQVAAIADDPGNKVRWWPLYHEPGHELIGRIQLSINYSQDENNHLRCGSVAETVAYDLVLEVAMKAQNFQQRNLLLKGPWKWLVTAFASYYGVSDAYTKLRYVSYVMDVATPTEDCLTLVHNLLFPIYSKYKSEGTLSHQEKRMLGEIEEKVQQILTLVFENYKSLDESLPSGVMDVFRPATGQPAAALLPAIKLYTLLHDILTPESQLKFCRYFQAAAKKRSRKHLAETDEFILSTNEEGLMDLVVLSNSYQKLKSLVLSMRNEISTDIEIRDKNVLPSFIDLPNLSASIYSVDLCNRLREFLVACPASGLSPPMLELIIATADLQRDISSWSIPPIKGGIDAKVLFHSYITSWIEEKRLALLASCKLDKVKWAADTTQHSTTPFIDDIYDQLVGVLGEYEIIICRWPEFAVVLEKAVTDVEKEIIKALERQYVDVLSPLKDSLTDKILRFKYVQKLAKGTPDSYVVPDELGVLLNSILRMLDMLHSKIESKFKSWCSLSPPSGNRNPGERVSEVTVMLKADLRNYIQAIVEKLVENTRIQSSTRLKKIIQDEQEIVVESDVASRMQPLKDLLVKMIDHLHGVFEPHMFVNICRTFWGRMGQDVLSFLENGREKRGYKSLRIAVSVLDDLFATQMQELLGNAIQGKDLEPPSSIKELHSMLDSENFKANYSHY